ncbi:expressed unknown protein [Seminavis robusta]|uniref:Uncharacterized protein n=1 Tax=Seminavis robusta TaxID=568900 RepID=A0A9N8E6V4_9STRA|nr:expressed unknown protein [Seminavis robusta]|eukprot:Sro739_g195390.1 n/a (101) ;mRNA; f:20016-20318
MNDDWHDEIYVCGPYSPMSLLRSELALKAERELDGTAETTKQQHVDETSIDHDAPHSERSYLELLIFAPTDDSINSCPKISSFDCIKTVNTTNYMYILTT